MAMVMKVRPWNAPEKQTTALRPVATRAILTAFSTASAPVVKKTDLTWSEIGTNPFSRSASRT